MQTTNKQLQAFSLVELLQEVQSRTRTETLSADQRQALMSLLMNCLASCVQAIERPFPRRDMNEIWGQNHVKRALEIAAAGGHNILLVGPGGAGKAQLARTLPSLLPTAPLPYSLREPVASMGKQAFVGGATTPGELTLAHDGVLFLRDLDTFDLSLLTVLSQTVETQVVSFPLQEENVVLPARFILVATVKPCPCGFCGVSDEPCLCSVQEVIQYRQRIAEVVRTCFAIEVDVPLIGEEIFKKYPGESSATIRRRVEAARLIQYRRYAETSHLRVNADLREVSEVQRSCSMVHPGPDLLKSALRQLQLTPLEVLRLQSVARTVADLDDSTVIAGNHLAEAIRYISGFVRYEDHHLLDYSRKAH